jgi:hypothetical protein
MREFTIGTGQASQYIHVLLGGKISSGKTTFAASAPAPLFFGDPTEGGYKVLEPPPKGKTDPRLFWDSRVKPDVWAMECMADYHTGIKRLNDMIAARKCPYKTLVFDSVSIYTQRVLAELDAKFSNMDKRQRYGLLGDSVTSLVAKIHALPMHVIWLCHVDDEGQLSVSGKASQVAWANMDYKMLIRVDIVGDKVNHQIQTVPYERVEWIGCRGGLLPNPMWASFKAFAHHIGLPEKPASPSLPPWYGEPYWDGVDFG